MNREKSIIKVIGVGVSGGMVVDAIYRQDSRICDFRVCDSDLDSPPRYAVPACFQTCSEATAPRILGHRTLMVIIVAFIQNHVIEETVTLAKMARESGFLTVAFVDGSHDEEGMQCKYLKELGQTIDSIFLFGISASDSPIRQAERMATAVRGIIEMIKYPSFFCFDYEDVRNALQDSGLAAVAFGEGAGVNRVNQAIAQTFSCEALKDYDLQSVQRILVNITLLGDSEINIVQIEEIFSAIGHRFPSKYKIKGNLISHKDPELGDKIRITMFLIGVQMREYPKRTLYWFNLVSGG